MAMDLIIVFRIIYSIKQKNKISNKNITQLINPNHKYSWLSTVHMHCTDRVRMAIYSTYALYWQGNNWVHEIN